MRNALISLVAILTIGLSSNHTRADDKPSAAGIFARDNLVAWCIVPFDSEKRGPEARAAMLERLGIGRLAYDYRAEHIPTFDAEIEALKIHGIELTAWWFPGTLDDEARLILDVLRRHDVQTQLWVSSGGGPESADNEEQWVRTEAERFRPIAEAAAEIGCTVGLYNHGGWFGEPENQIKIIRRLGLPNVGIVYNLHHGHAHLDRFAELLDMMRPHLLALNLNGMTEDGDQHSQKILPLGAGDLDVSLLRTIRDSGYDGPIGILNHTDHDAEARLTDNLVGLAWLLPQLDGEPATPQPIYRTWQQPYDEQFVAELATEALANGVAERGVGVFADAKSACLSCHKIGRHGGTVGPDLTKIGHDRTAAEITESLHWPNRTVAAEYSAVAVLTTDGKLHEGYAIRSNDRRILLREPATDTTIDIPRAEIDEEAPRGSLMPEGLTAAMSHAEQLDLIRFLASLGRDESLSVADVDTALSHAHGHAPAKFPYDRAPLDPARWPHWQDNVNRDRLYDYYTKEAEYFRAQHHVPMLLPEFPGLDDGRFGHWGNQNEQSWADDRWNDAVLGSVQCGVFRGAGVTVPRGVCVRLGERGEMSVCFNPDTLTYDAVWTDGFVKFSSVRHGFVGGVLLDGVPLEIPDISQLADMPRPEGDFEYFGFYRYGHRVVFSYRIGQTHYLDAPWIDDGKFSRTVAPIKQHPLRHVARGGPSQWPARLESAITLGTEHPYAIDTIELPLDNPWRAPMFIGDHDFLPDGSALVCTIQGDVWHVSGLVDDQDDADSPPTVARWRRFASGLHHALGLVVADDGIYVQGRDQITRLVDANDDGEADFYECHSNAFETSPAGHDFICGLQRDREGNFYTASGNQGLVRISPDGKRADAFATGFRNPGGLGLDADGIVTVPCSEGEWSPASMICAVRTSPPAPSTPDVASNISSRNQRAPSPEDRGGGYVDEHTPPFFGYRGPRDNQPPDLPLVYLPRGVDNSSGGQAYIDSDRWGPLAGKMLHFSFGMGAHFLLLRDEVDGQMQGGIVPLAGEFLSGAQRGRFNPLDGQLYVSGMAGWGSYGSADGCLQRVRYSGHPVQLPCGFHVHENGVTVTFTQPISESIAAETANHFVQCWNYRYSEAYGSPEFSPRHYGTRGHDALDIGSAHVLGDAHTLFLEIPELQPVNQLHLRMHVDTGPGHDLFLTVHKLGRPFTDFLGYEPTDKTIAAHPILSDLALATKRVPNPWREPIQGARSIVLETGKNLTFATRSLHAMAGEAIALTLVNPDVVPHNWALVAPDALRRVGEMANRLVADPDAVALHYIPQTSDVLAYTDVVGPQEEFTIHFRVPDRPGRYPFLCTFPGHWMVMNGELIVE